MEGYIAYKIYYNSVDRDCFNAFIKDSVLPLISAYLEPCSVLIINNHSTHHLEELQELCDARGIVLLYLPPYSPDYNSIKQSFTALKAWMRGHRELVRTFSDDFKGFIRLAVKSVFKDINAYRHFRAAGIGIPGHYKIDNKVKDAT
jgi:transposase